MTIQIGRFGQSPTVRSASAWDGQGDRASVTVPVLNTTLGEVTALRQQALGMVDNPDEPVVPVVWSADPTVDGYYRVADVSFPMNPASARYDTLFTASFELERVISYASPLWESHLLGGTLSNGLGITGAPFFAFPDGSPANPRTYTGVTEAVNRSVQAPSGAAANLRTHFLNAFTWPSGTSAQRWRMPPADYYTGAATLEWHDGSAYRPIPGHQIERNPTDFRLSNGMVRCTIANESSEAELHVEHWDGSAWDTAKDFRFEAVLAYVLGVFTDISVIRNSPEEVAVRLATIGSNEGLITIDLSLRRGDRWIRGYLQSQTARQWLIVRDASEASTSITGGVRATSNDASGNRYMLASATLTTKNTADGGLYHPTTATAVDFGIGSEIAGSGASGTNAATGTRSMIEQYFAAQGERVAVAGR